ncbi:putative inactive receptor kinase [Cinnamomum micranthum f. kanehirae]|uniref:Putative inactive receptor kinase n=1 Tax=Cinnamomum micranthum f. kanehirae TaxID=337451 RepID=A0A443P2V2_9MAGN|nr:putative inactive receptor kinase [Cinnamomum micranthum f. kanehirae]
MGFDLASWVNSVVREEWTTEVFDKALTMEGANEECMVNLLQVALKCVNPFSERGGQDSTMRVDLDLNGQEGVRWVSKGRENGGDKYLDDEDNLLSWLRTKLPFAGEKKVLQEKSQEGLWKKINIHSLLPCSPSDTTLIMGNKRTLETNDSD